MSTTIDAPLEWVETVSSLRLPPKADQRLQELMDRNNEGLLTEAERADLESLVELSERLSLVRAEALHLLGADPNDLLERDWTGGGAARCRTMRILPHASVFAGGYVPRRTRHPALSGWNV